jgi:ketosteroid isomerase-like protein
VAARLAGGHDVTVEIMAFDVVGDMAYTAAVVRFVGTIDGSAPRRFALRATSVFRREDGEWKVIHEHTDFLSPDDS